MDAFNNVASPGIKRPDFELNGCMLSMKKDGTRIKNPSRSLAGAVTQL